MATAYIGGVGHFDHTKETFSSYTERLDMFFLANNIVDVVGAEPADLLRQAGVVARKKAIFLREIGAEVYTVLVNLTSPDKPRDKTLDELFTVLKAHFNPAPLEISESFHFGKRDQRSGENVSDYILALKKLTLHCNFENYLNRALRDKFVGGLLDSKIQNKLLNIADLTFEHACRIASAMEMASKQAKEMRPSGNSNGVVNKVGESDYYKKQTPSGGRKNRGTVSCYRCGANHLAPNCPHKDVVCRKCEKTGHSANRCKSNMTASGKPTGDSRHKSYKSKSGGVNLVAETDEFGADDDELGIYNVYAVSSEKTGYFVTLDCNNTPCELQVDTAADFSIMCKTDFDTKFACTQLERSNIRLKTYTGDHIKVCGTFDCNVLYNKQQVTLPMVVVDHVDRPALLGRNWLAKLKLDWGQILSVNTVKRTGNAKARLDLLLRKHSRLFEDSYDGMKGHEAHIRVKPDAAPVFHKPRNCPYAIRDRVELELDKLEKNGVMKKIDRSDWASPIVVVPKADGSVRICGDYKVSVNGAVEDEQTTLPTTQDLYQQLSGSKAKMDQILQGIPKTVCKQDDILMGGDDDNENLDILERVLDRLSENNVHLKLPKCKFLETKTVYLGLEYSGEGLRPVESSVERLLSLRMFRS
ncbi:uncharacterized protein K02A2.6-like [Lineus longissimus]|uniref:uncharacterized protein K02A2.6-like n=1 Tax=Lineus longissimus TaxID=88925 RepID=UPI00315CB9EE